MRAQELPESSPRLPQKARARSQPRAHLLSGVLDQRPPCRPMAHVRGNRRSHPDSAGTPNHPPWTSLHRESQNSLHRKAHQSARFPQRSSRKTQTSPPVRSTTEVGCFSRPDRVVARKKIEQLVFMGLLAFDAFRGDTGADVPGAKRAVVRGHTHLPALCYLNNDSSWMNPGSVGYNRPDDPSITTR